MHNFHLLAISLLVYCFSPSGLPAWKSIYSIAVLFIYFLILPLETNSQNVLIWNFQDW